MNATMQTIVGLNKAYAAKRGGGVIAGYWEAHLLDTGAIAIFDEANNLIQIGTTLAEIASVQKFYIAQGNVSQATTPKVTIPIDRNAFTQWYNGYVAPVLQTWRIGEVASVGSLNLPGTILNGTFATVVVTNRPGTGYTPNATERYTLALNSADTSATVLTRMRDLINADPSAIVTATILDDATNTYLQLAAKVVTTIFEVGVDDTLAFATRYKDGAGGTVNGFQGFGTQEKVAAALIEDRITRGGSTLTTGGVPYYTNPDVLDGQSGLTFVGWTIQWKEEATRAATTIQTALPTVAFFVQVAATGLANITTIMNLMFMTPSGEAGGSASGLSSGEFATVNPIPAGGEG